MSFNNNNNKSNDVIDYLIKKLESRLKGINKKKDIFNNITNIENFYLNKNIFLKLFSELFEDIQQAIYAIKTLYLENKILNQENINNKQYLNDVKNKNYFNNISKTPNRNFNKNNFLDNNNYYFNYNLTDDSNNNNYFNKIENAEEIMKNIQENKQLLKEKINKHFNNFNYENDFNENNNNFNNKNFNNNNNNFNNKNFNNNNNNNKNNNIKNINTNFSNNFNNNNNSNNNNFMQNIKRYLPNYKKPQKKKSNSQRKNSKIPLRIGIQSLNNNTKKNTKKLNKSFESTNFYRNSGKILPAFEFSLRNYPNQSKSISKQFNNYTNPYGNYFSSFDYLN